MTLGSTSPYIQTPLVPSLYLSDLLGVNVLLKLELLQPSGSFKSRGLGHIVHQTVIGAPRGTRFHFFSLSGCNTGCATAYATRLYNQRWTICPPTTTNPVMVERIRKTGAIVVISVKYIIDAEKYIKDVLMPQCPDNPVFCHPYNDKLVWEGNSTIANEIVSYIASGAGNNSKSGASSESIMIAFKNAVTIPDAVICAVGGGGLYNGLVKGFKLHG